MEDGGRRTEDVDYFDHFASNLKGYPEYILFSCMSTCQVKIKLNYYHYRYMALQYFIF